MLRCYLRETWPPPPTKLLVMEVCLGNSELLLYPILLTSTVISPLLIRHGAMPLSKREPLQLVSIALQHLGSGETLLSVDLYGSGVIGNVSKKPVPEVVLLVSSATRKFNVFRAL
jgi:hypothetical protein